jgi:adenine/guanine phosphoribosyltransferase-like PRPP-binding protein
LRVDSNLLERPRRITIVDDFVTKGATLLAAASRVQEAFPEAEVRAFALVRTKGLVADIESISEPCEGLITRVGDHVDRQP